MDAKPPRYQIQREHGLLLITDSMDMGRLIVSFGASVLKGENAEYCVAVAERLCRQLNEDANARS